MAKDHFVAVLPDGTEHFGEVAETRLHRDWELENLAKEAVRKAGIQSPRKNPIKVKVQVFALTIKEGKMERRLVVTAEVQPTLERMTDAEYNEEMAEILKPFPEVFHPYVRGEAYDRGHSAGMEEVISIARSISDALLPCLQKFCKQWDIKAV